MNKRELKSISLWEYIEKLKLWLKGNGGWTIAGTDCEENWLPDIIIEYYEKIKDVDVSITKALEKNKEYCIEQQLAEKDKEIEWLKKCNSVLANKCCVSKNKKGE